MELTENKLFEGTKPSRLFFKAAIPGAASMLASSLYIVIDSMLVGRYLGETAFAAINLVMPFVIIMNAVADLIGVGSSVPVSIALGRREEGRANNIFSCCIFSLVLAGMVFGWGFSLLAPSLVSMMGAEGELASLAVQYFRVYALAAPLTTAIFAMDNYLRICGKIRGSLCLNILMAVLSAGLEFLFLAVLGLGIWAAALAWCISMFVSVLIALTPFLLGRMQLKFQRPHFSFHLLRQVVYCGTPAFLNNVAGRVVSILMNFFLLREGGETAVSVYGILMNVEFFVQSLLYGMCDSLQPAVGYNHGAGHHDRVRAIEKWCFGVAAAVSLLFGGLIFLCPDFFVRLYMAKAGEALFSMAVPAVSVFSLTFLTRWLSFSTQSYLLATEHPAEATIISVSSLAVFPLLFLFVLPPLTGGLLGYWLNMPATALCAAALALLLLLKRKKENRP